MADNKNVPAKKGGPKEYFKGVRSEMKKVVWPTKKETINYTGVVIVTCCVFAFGFWVFNTGFLALLQGIIGVSL